MKNKNNSYPNVDKDLLRFSNINKDLLLNSLTVGKPRKIVVDIFKRFIQNKYAMFATFVLFGLILTAIISWIVSPFKTNEPISKVTSSFITNLRPSFEGRVDFTIDTEKLNIISAKYPELLQGVEPKYVAPNEWTIYVNPYEIIKVLSDKQKTLPAFFGTDSYGRDIWLRTWVGTLNALGIALAIAIIETLIGVVIGAYLGFNVGKKIDTYGYRLLEIFSSIPWVILFIILVSIMGATPLALILIISLTGWTSAADTTRSFTISVKDEEYVKASKAIGASNIRLIFSHILPAIPGKLANSFVLKITHGILVVSSVAFLGFIQEGVDSAPNLGLIITSSSTLINFNPWALAFPAIILLTIALSLRFIALGFHDALDVTISNKKGKA
ncbi:ABC transporter permease [Mesomycoplasma neurolyticum]|uniref:Oligopeptide transport system permease protein oppC n=1 Tax=Mesomycoplasma neurolyticum TaxID=2120 RepID=A0A449A6I5_9BACT|nr:ABC transporter permease [Mesomycoplasma neurolyticum]VEU59846.1 Oligopeptide transport system permease protein oppC [Mesomycoplasma neurolyticum]